MSTTTDEPKQSVKKSGASDKPVLEPKGLTFTGTLIAKTKTRDRKWGEGKTKDGKKREAGCMIFQQYTYSDEHGDVYQVQRTQMCENSDAPTPAEIRRFEDADEFAIGTVYKLPVRSVADKDGIKEIYLPYSN